MRRRFEQLITADDLLDSRAASDAKLGRFRSFNDLRRWVIKWLFFACFVAPPLRCALGTWTIVSIGLFLSQTRFFRGFWGVGKISWITSCNQVLKCVLQLLLVRLFELRVVKIGTCSYFKRWIGAGRFVPVRYICFSVHLLPSWLKRLPSFAIIVASWRAQYFLRNWIFFHQITSRISRLLDGSWLFYNLDPL